jgi:DNA-binding response OmpR family regulator
MIEAPQHMALRNHLVQVVDDDPGSQRRLRVVLEADGFSVVASDTCGGGELEATSRPPDLELIARVRAALRFHARGAWLPTGVLELDDLSNDLGRRIVRQGDRCGQPLTRLEYRVLEVLVRGRHRVVTRAEIIKEGWGPDSGRSLKLHACVSLLIHPTS